MSGVESGRGLVHLLLVDQARLTAVERFAQKHEAEDRPHNEPYYRDLIPLTAPRDGQQYAFEVDLDACTGCKACVTACHTLNGLDETEIWRSVGLLYDGGGAAPFQQTVTTACHHCVDPACLSGCPVGAYDKDPITGIVKHLDDQCIGCQYCILKCPYDVPKYNAEKGIVRKCDMCKDRLEGGEAPACVQACPNGAIRIGLARTDEIVTRTAFLAAAPSPAYTKPATRYTSGKGMPEGVVGGDHLRLQAEPAHTPLVFMLVVTQLSVGVLVIERLLARAPYAAPAEVLAAVACVTGIAGVHLSLLHLGRPLYAFRAFLGVATSWLSREVIAFGALMPALAAYAAARSAHAIGSGVALPPALVGLAGDAVAILGLGAVFCSVMVYVDTRRASWSWARTAAKFFLTTLLLGFATTIACARTVDLARALAPWMVAAMAAKLGVDLSILHHLAASERTPLKRTALLMTRVLGRTTAARLALGAAGGIACPLAILVGAPSWIPLFAALGLALALAGELCERALFFTTVSSSRMPGTPLA